MNAAVINVIAFQAGWFSCVLGAAQGMPWLGPVVAVPILAWHLHKASNVALELKMILVATLIGSLFDQVLLSAGLLQYPSLHWPAGLLPLWMVTL